ncbi:MAG TPA: N-6 DNA methylase, partial [Acidobacteriaceae bacterium]|nr:N-6 DNA methylase [Acidobacteriaceae bacterium]
MTVQSHGRWHESAGISRALYPSLFLSPSDVTPGTPQAHVVRHAFDLLELDGVFCTEGAPIVFFKLVENFALDEVLAIHRRFWNHGGAPVLVLISSDRAEIYSGMSRPIRREDVGTALPSLVATLENLITAVPEFLLAIESGAFFREYARSFDASRRVDRDLLSNLGDVRTKLSDGASDAIPIDVLDALLCRLVFTCYLFDRGVVGQRYLEELDLGSAKHLRDVLSQRPLSKAKAGLFKIFRKLSEDFNGDLFSENIETAARHVSNQHIAILDDFFQGTRIGTGQRSFWPYDFQYIPIETISAIYEHFLKAEDQEDGAFYTPRFLAEIVLDSALEGMGSLLGKRFLDPACGSGIFLVGLFNRIAEEWKVANPNAHNDRRARELSHILQQNLFGIDINQTACRIAAFSLYLAYLDQLSPRDIQTLQEKGRALPRLIAEPSTSDEPGKTNEPGTIRCADFFDDQDFPRNVDLIVGNPPWGSTAGPKTRAGLWCARAGRPLPD